jgi:hypothetical protein
MGKRFGKMPLAWNDYLFDQLDVTSRRARITINVDHEG